MTKRENKNFNNLIPLLKSSNSEAFEESFRELHDNIFNYLFFKIGDSQTAEDLLQDVFVKLWENRYQLKEELSLPAYLYTIAKNLTANYYRHKIVVQNFQKELELRADQENFSSPLFHLELNELKNNFIKALEKLPGQQRTVFMMSRHDNLSHKEIANRLNISIKTVETHIGKALKSLRKALKSGS